MNQAALSETRGHVHLARYLSIQVFTDRPADMVDNLWLHVCVFASSALYRFATYDLRGSNYSSKAEGDLLKLKLFLECQRNNYLYVGHVLRAWFEGMPAAIGWPGGGTCMPPNETKIRRRRVFEEPMQRGLLPAAVNIGWS